MDYGSKRERTDLEREEKPKRKNKERNNTKRRRERERCAGNHKRNSSSHES
jgi:hypothetical protein